MVNRNIDAARLSSWWYPRFVIYLVFLRIYEGNRVKREKTIKERRRLHQVAAAGVIGMFHGVIKISLIYHGVPNESIFPWIQIHCNNYMSRWFARNSRDFTSSELKCLLVINSGFYLRAQMQLIIIQIILILLIYRDYYNVIFFIYNFPEMLIFSFHILLYENFFSSFNISLITQYKYNYTYLHIL